MLDIEPIPRRLYDRAKDLGVTEIALEWRGGSDVGYLDVRLCDGVEECDNDELKTDVEAWAWDAYEYNGAGDGSNYGDHVIYDLKNNTATTSEWYESRAYSEPEKLNIDE